MNTGNARMDERSRTRLRGVNPDLVRLIESAAKTDQVRFIVTEGLRTRERQQQLVAAGASRTMNSRHITGHAVDLAVVVNGEVRWDWPLYKTLADVVKAHSLTTGVPIEWGGDWKTFRDGPHFQLPRRTHP